MRKFIYYIVLLTLQFITINIYAISTPLIDVDTCSVTIFQNDTTYYSTPTPFYIQLNASQGAYSYNWIPATGLSDPTIYNPMAQINGSIEYVLEAKYLGDNLVYNGDFELGNIGFTTGLLLPSQSSSPYGTYIVASNATSLYPGLCSCTHNGGLFMVADGSPNPTTTFQTQVNVEPNTDYKFSVEFTNVNQSPDFTDGWRPIFQFSVNGAILGSPIIVSSDCCSWNRFYQVWNSSNNTHATISIINLNTSSAGNDFCIDNVSLKKICIAHDTIDITILPTISDIDTCSIRIPYDTTIYSINSVEYQLSTNQGASIYHWYPSSGLSDTRISNPIATISNSTQYILEAIYESDSNLVYNGDFELGNVGFTTQLGLSTYNPLQEGFYNIVTIANRYHNGFVSCTNNGGRFFVANGSQIPNTIVYQSIVNVEPNTDYTFAFETTNVSASTIQNQLPRFQFSVNGVQLGNTFTISSQQCLWTRFYQTWNSGSNTTATITILNQNTIAGGNDFGIDNISLRKICIAHDTINITILPTISDIDTCSIRIPEDTTIYSINPVEYQLSTNREADFYKWTPSIGLSDPTISNPIATINNSVQYILEAGFISDTNLVYNGNFELGNVGFTTQYILGANPLQEGRYGITNYGPTLHNNFSPCTHDGNFYAGNASLYNSLVVFQSQISVTPNTDYYFSAEVTGIDSNSTHPINQLAVFQFNINNIQIGNTLQVNNSPCVWTSYGEFWNSGNNTIATITIKDLNTGLWANDFALDNVSLRTICKAYDTIN
ncbi:MAG: hypothetical protein WCR29_01025, partial [Bacteroidales bacterium]